MELALSCLLVSVNNEHAQQYREVYQLQAAAAAVPETWCKVNDLLKNAEPNYSMIPVCTSTTGAFIVVSRLSWLYCQNYSTYY